MKKIIFVFGAALVLLFAACKSGPSSSDPKATLLSFFKALSKKDLKEARKYATKESESMFGLMEMGMKMAENMKKDDDDFDKFKDENLVMGDARIEGDKAFVPVKNKKDNESTNFILKKEDGSWKVAFDKATMAEMAGEKIKENGDHPVNMDSLNAIMQDLNSDSMRNALKEGLGAMDSLQKALKDVKKD